MQGQRQEKEKDQVHLLFGGWCQISLLAVPRVIYPWLSLELSSLSPVA